MKNFFLLFTAVLPLASCTGSVPVEGPQDGECLFSKGEMARIFAELPLGESQLGEVYDAVNSSSGNGYDEEYMLSDLFLSPGSGVGDRALGTKAGNYSRPIRDMLTDYISERYGNTKAGAADAERYLRSLSSSDLQIYWPYSEDWDGVTYPIITFDPGYGAESNYGYEWVLDDDGVRVLDSLLVTEETARCRPVWVINNNDDSAFTPLEMFTKASSSSPQNKKCLKMKDFTMYRNYDSWFAGASEFFIRMGAVDGFKATKDEDLKLYSPSITDFSIVVKRKELGKKIPFESILLTDFTDQMDKFAFLITEDDGGTTTSWKCSATVKYNSKSYGFDMDIPYKDKDDIVWRGQLSSSFLRENPGGLTYGRFGDVGITFSLE